MSSHHELRVDTSADAASFRAWMRDAGVLLNGVDIGCSSDGSASVDTSSYRGVVALRDLDCGEVIVELPTDSVIAHSAPMGGGGAMTPSLKAWMRNSMRMRLPRIRREMLVREMALRLISTPRAGLQYIDSYLLNESNVSRLVCGHPVFWSTAERDAMLSGTSVNVMMNSCSGVHETPSLASAACRKRFVRAVMKALKKPKRNRSSSARFEKGKGVDDAHNDHDDDGDDNDEREAIHRRCGASRRARPAVCRAVAQIRGEDVGDKIDAAFVKNVYDLATGLVAAYSFSLGERGRHQCMCPFFDVLNHEHEDQCHVVLRHISSRDVLQMVMRRPCRRGDECFNCYGKLSPAELLWRYGFVPSHQRRRQKDDAMFLDMSHLLTRPDDASGVQMNAARDSINGALTVDRAIARRLGHIRRYANAIEESDLIFHVGWLGVPSASLLETVRILTTTKCTSASEGKRARDDDDKMPSDGDVHRVLATIESAARRRLVDVRGTLARLQTASATETTTQHEQRASTDGNGCMMDDYSDALSNFERRTLAMNVALVEVEVLESLVAYCVRGVASTDRFHLAYVSRRAKR